MELKNFECQLAKAQLARYLKGGAISDEALEALEAHLAECEDCQVEILKHRAEAAAQAPAPTAPQQAVVETKPQEPAAQESDAESITKRSKFNLRDALLAKIQNLPTNVRPIVLSTALALVLVLMSWIANDPTKVFGPRASADPKKVVASGVVKSDELTAADRERSRFTANNPNNSNPTKTAVPPTKPAVKPVENKPNPTVPAKPAVKPASKPTPRTTTKPAPHTSSRPVVNHRRTTPTKPKATTKPRKPTPKPTPRTKTPPKPSSGIVVYDEHGKRIN